MIKHIIGYATMVLLMTFAPAAAAPDNRPLYEDSLTHWQIWKAIPGETVVAPYAEAYESYGSMTPNAPIEYKYLYWHAPAFWYLFSLVIPDDVQTYWPPTTEFMLEYEHRHGGRVDTLQAKSNIMFFVNGRRTEMFILYELDSPFMVPNPAMPIYSATQVPAVFVRFDFNGKQPDRLLRVRPADVRAQRR